MITSVKFNELYSKLNPAQKKAVDTIEGPVMVIAGPGTGKTQILTLRIANILLCTQINPENILALTFTEAAAFEMRKRLVDIIGTLAYRVEITTFHGFCNDIIQNYSEDFPHLISADSINEVEQIQLLENLILQSDLKFLRPIGEPLYYLRAVLSEINNLKKEGVRVEDFKESIEKQVEDFNNIEDLYHEKGKYKGEMKGKYQDTQKDIEKNKELLILYSGYQELLKKQKKYDFNDMLLEVQQTLESKKNLLLRLQEKYQYILIDEHQDTNSAQNKIAELLGNYFDNPNLFIVGDEKQAIYRFQGASLENFLYFKKLYPSALVINLEDNYRSHQLILDAADSLIRKNLASQILLGENIKLNAHTREALDNIKLARVNDYFCEYQFLIDNIQTRNKNGTKFSDIAIIARNNKDLFVMAENLERSGVPYTIQADQNILGDIYIQKLIFIFEAINNPTNNSHLLKAMYIDLFGLDIIDVYKINKIAYELDISISEVLDGLDEEKATTLGIKDSYNLKTFWGKIKSWHIQSFNESLESLYINVLKDSGLRELMLKSLKRYELLDKLIALFEEIKNAVGKNAEYRLADFLNYLALCKKHEIPMKKNIQTSLKDAVNLLTAHRSKGLEFDYVYIINSFDGHWGNSKRRSKSFKIAWHHLGVKLNVEMEENEDERRLFYVAMTRAKKGITFSYSTKSMDGKEQLPCQFLTEIDPSLVEIIDTSSYERDFTINKDILFDPKIQLPLPSKNIEFLQEIFLTKGISATALDNYEDCPWKFFYRNLLLLPSLKTESLIFGTAIHYALDVYIKNRSSRKTDLNFLLNKFNESIKEEPLTEQMRKSLIQKGEKILEGYFNQVIPNWGNNIQSEMIIKGVKLSNGTVLTGRLDMIEIMGNGTDVIVHDFKTGKPKTRSQIDGSNQKSEYNYLQQLVFYKLLLDKYKGGILNMTQGVINFVEPDEKGRFKSETFLIDKDASRALENKILLVSKEIMNLEFWDKRCGKKDCEFCKLRDITMGES